MISLANISIEDEKTFPCMYFAFKKLIKKHPSEGDWDLNRLTAIPINLMLFLKFVIQDNSIIIIIIFIIIYPLCASWHIGPWDNSMVD